MELKQAKTTVESIKTMVTAIREVSLDDMIVIGELNPTIIDNIEFIRNWFTGNTEFNTNIIKECDTPSTPAPLALSPFENPWLAVDPDATWLMDARLNIMVSSSGLLWDLSKNKLFDRYFIDGDLRIQLTPEDPNDFRRVAPIIARVFRKNSNHQEDCVIEYINGDRRDCSINNIKWTPKTTIPDMRQLLIEDVCRRIIEFNGDISEIMPLYKYSKPSICEETIAAIITKTRFSEISDTFFEWNGVDIIPVPQPDPNSLNVGEFFVMSKDRALSVGLIKDKIAKDEPLTIMEKEILVFIAAENTVNPTPANIAETIDVMFNYNISDTYVEQTLSSSSVIANIFKEG